MYFLQLEFMLQITQNFVDGVEIRKINNKKGCKLY